MGEEKKLILLKELLLTDDRTLVNSLQSRIKELESIIEKQEKLSKKINPIIDDKLNAYSKEIPKKLGPTITKSLKNEIENSKDRVVDALYPIIGKMIKKYIKREFKVLSEKITQQLQKSFSFKNWSRKFKAKFSGIKEESLVINDLALTEIQEVFIINKESGILLANFSKTNTIDKEVLSAMLTAIKSFVEEALKLDQEDLESIEYGTYNIHLQNFGSFYVAVVLHGVSDNIYKNKLETKLYSFAEKHLTNKNPNTNLSEKLAKYFKDDNI
ncbi:cell envelope biogenesis protein OmpA [Seonamhaeicola marinus]|uniref:Cell envelope biogenesis protein OmpA n=1 Tax=Seonamhaeicola marinus TaxID=1912246 RepID=A0A5D0IU62_9FLAO|nr:cell envelope biogenesis protein OmpA [Seonamhaeicola marinus]TYA86748.1 cell envelope biogenesis protein OmpA [Seonamhaeicola marinus]